MLQVDLLSQLLSILPLNPPSQPTISTHNLNIPSPPSQSTISTYPLHISSLHTFSTSSPHTVPVASQNKKPSSSSVSQPTTKHLLSTHLSTPSLTYSASGISKQKAIILISLFIYIGGYQVGFGPISWLMISEIFPLEVRGKAVSLAVVTNFFWNTVMTFFFPVELDFIGM